MAPDANDRTLISPSIILWLLGILLMLWFLWEIQQMLFLVLVSMILAAAMYPAVSWLRQKHIPDRLAVLLFYLLFVLLNGGLAYLTVELLVEQIQQFLLRLPEYTETSTRYLEQWVTIPGDADLAAMIRQQIEQTATRAVDFLLSAADYIRMLVAGFISILVILIFTYYLVADVKYFESVLLGAFPTKHRNRVASLLRTLATKVGAYVRGQLIVMILSGIMAWIGLTILGVPYALVLAALTFIMNIIPMIGSTITGVVVTLVALGQSPIIALWALLLFLGIQVVENYIIAPNVLGRSLKIHPAWVLLSVLIGATLAGIMGLILAVPVAVILKIVISEFYVYGWLQRHEESEAIKTSSRQQSPQENT